MRWSMLWRTVLCAGTVALAVAPAAEAQAPPPADLEASEIATCLCMGQAMGSLNADLAARRQAYSEARAELGQLDSQLQQERATMDVNNPQSVARFRALLARRDGLFRRSTGPLVSELSNATARYNATVNEYNSRCAGRPRDPDLLARVQATLSCPAP